MEKKERQLKKYGKHSFEYNSDGIRTARYFDTDADGETVQVRFIDKIAVVKISVFTTAVLCNKANGSLFCFVCDSLNTEGYFG